MQEHIVSICLGVGLAAAAGFRVFLPLLVASIAGYLGVLPLNEHWEWIGSTPAILVLAVATFVEIAAYFIPWLDNVLDTIAVPLATVAGTAVMMATVADLSPLMTWTLAIIAGGGTATAIKSGMGASRLASTASTAGVANPVIATFETGAATMMSMAALFFPFLAIIFALLFFLGIRKLYIKLFRRSS